jgi:trehalose/maltose hydrolase-like predicted phosphorylase
MVKRFWPVPFLALSPLILTGCPGKQNEPDTVSAPPPNITSNRSAGAFAKTDPWLLTTTDPNAARGNHGIYLGNGFLGATFGPTGGAGKDSVCYVAGLYDAQENLKSIPNWNDLGLPEPKPGEEYEQTLDMKRGVLTTKMGDVTVTSFVSAATPYLAMLHVEGAPPPTGQPPLTPNESRLRSSITVNTLDGGKSWTRVVYIEDNNNQGASHYSDYAAELAKHEAAWAKIWQTRDITIEGDPEAQQLVHKLLFDLLQSIRSSAIPNPPYSIPHLTSSIPPEALSGNFYKGHIFWDAEVWMFPALLAQHPNLARTMLDYRANHLDEARKQAKAQGCEGADFPWESAGTGKETAPGGFKEGRHVTAGIGWATWQYWLATGDKTWMQYRGWSLLSNIADYFASRAKKDPATGKYHIYKVFGPDELTGMVDDNTYTNAMARDCLLYATEAAKLVPSAKANPKWKEVAEGLVLPFDKAKGHYLTRANDDGRSVKQADGELVIYPAALPMDDATREKTFDFQKTRPIKNGPAMTTSIHALIAARLGRSKEAEGYFRESYKPFIRGPFLLFSEKRSLDRCVFTTGAGGILQSVMYGFGGLDFSRPEGIVAGKPALPPTWTKLTINGVQRGGKRYTLTVTPTGRTLKPE